MNMIRVWGGGLYEPDAFYETCDELGLLVWQDFMFACSHYPSTPEFLADVDAEVRYQVKRLGHHASLALWCGDNEVIGSLNWFERRKKNRDRYLVNYDRLNRAIEIAVAASDPDRRFWPSSPCPARSTSATPGTTTARGDMHFWSVWHEGTRLRALPRRQARASAPSSASSPSRRCTSSAASPSRATGTRRRR